MAFLNTDKLWYIATYTDEGDFSSLSEKGYETLALANAGAGFPEGTPAGELVQDGEVVEKAVAPEPTPEPTAVTVATGVQPEAPVEVAPTTEETPVVAPETAPTTEPTAVVEVNEETKTVTFDNGDTAPLVTREEVVAELGEEKVAEIEATAEVLPTEPVAEVPAEPTAPVTEETAPVTA